LISSIRKEIELMSYKEFKKVAHTYPVQLPRIFDEVDDDMLLSTEDIVELTGVKSHEAVRNWIRTGKLRVHSPIGKYLVHGDDLKEFMFERFKKVFLKDN
jgi:hypothetical protein